MTTPRQLVGGSLIALIITGLVCAPKAHADEDTYIWNLENDGSTYFYGNRAAMIDLGYRICYDLRVGNTIAQETDVVLINPAFDFNYPAARTIVLHAEENLC
jgi:hypothetical protein